MDWIGIWSVDFCGERKPENPEKNPRSRGENQHQTQPTCDARSGNRTRATAVGGKRSHHCAIPAQSVTSGKQDYTYDLLKGCINNTINWINHYPVDSLVCFAQVTIFNQWIVVCLVNSVIHSFSNWSQGFTWCLYLELPSWNCYMFLKMLVTCPARIQHVSPLT